MSYAAARLTPTSEEYLTLDPSQPTMKREDFAQINHMRHVERALHDQMDEQVKTALEIANRIWTQIVQALQDVSFIPRGHFAGLAHNLVANWFDLDEHHVPECLKPPHVEEPTSKTMEHRLSRILVAREDQRFKGCNYLTTLTPDIVAITIRYSLEKALKEICKLDIEPTEQPVENYATLVDPYKREAGCNLRELPVINPSTQGRLDKLLSPTGTKAVEGDLRLLAEAVLVRAHLSKEACSGCAYDVFQKYPMLHPDDPLSDQVQMSTLNPLDFVRILRSFLSSNIALELALKPDFKQHILARIRQLHPKY